MGQSPNPLSHHEIKLNRHCVRNAVKWGKPQTPYSSRTIDVLPGLKPRDSRLLHGKRAQFSSPPHG